MRIAFDTNILGYLAGLKRSSADPAKVQRAREIVAVLNASNHLVVATQVLGELYNIMVKGGLTRDEAREIVMLYAAEYEVVTSTHSCFFDAFSLAVDHQLQIWDALIVTTSAAAGCGLLLSEDMQDGRRFGGIIIANPFERRPIAALAALLT